MDSYSSRRSYFRPFSVSLFQGTLKEHNIYIGCCWWWWDYNQEDCCSTLIIFFLFSALGHPNQIQLCCVGKAFKGFCLDFLKKCWNQEGMFIYTLKFIDYFKEFPSEGQPLFLKDKHSHWMTTFLLNNILTFVHSGGNYFKLSSNFIVSNYLSID